MNIFAINNTQNEEGELDGIGFRTRTLPEAGSLKLKEAASEIETLENKMKPSIWIQIAMWASGIAAIVLAAATLTSIKTIENFKEAFSKAPVFFILIPVLIAVWAVLTFVTRRKQTGAKDSDEKKTIDEKYREIKDSSLRSLGAPGDALPFDVMSYIYTEKGGLVTVTHEKYYDYVLLPMFAFIEDGKFCLCSLEERFEIKLSEIKGLEEVRRKVRADSWTKDKAPEESYKDGAVAIDKRTSAVSFAPYFSLEICRKDEDFNILFPFWEYETFVSLTGIEKDKD